MVRHESAYLNLVVSMGAIDSQGLGEKDGVNGTSSAGTNTVTHALFIRMKKGKDVTTLADITR